MAAAARTDCLTVIDAAVNYPPDNLKRFRCADGDPCDADGVVNGVCQFDVTICSNSSYNPTRCTLVGVDPITVDHAIDNGDRKFDPTSGAAEPHQQRHRRPDRSAEHDDPDRCTTPPNIRVPITGPTSSGSCKLGKKQVKITTLFIQGPKPVKDTDKLLLICDPPDPCNPGVLFNGTFDRIQRQIFNRSCALSGCHDSQTQAGGSCSSRAPPTRT